MDDVQFRAGPRRQIRRALGRQVRLLRAVRSQEDLRRKDYRPPAHHQNRAVGVANNRVGDAAHESSPYPPPAPAAKHYQTCLQLLGQLYNLFSGTPHPKVALGDGAPHVLDLVDLLVEDPSALSLGGPRPGVAGLEVVGKGGSDVEYVKLGAGDLCQADGGGGGSPGGLRTVAKKKEPCPENS